MLTFCLNFLPDGGFLFDSGRFLFILQPRGNLFCRLAFDTLCFFSLRLCRLFTLGFLLVCEELAHLLFSLGGCQEKDAFVQQLRERLLNGVIHYELAFQASADVSYGFIAGGYHQAQLSAIPVGGGNYQSRFVCCLHGLDFG